MNGYRNEIDLEVLKSALENYSASLPDEVLESLLETLKRWQNQEPNAAQNLCELVSQTEALERIYTQTLIRQRQQYQTQERTKSYVLTAAKPGHFNGQSNIITELIHAIKQFRWQESAIQASAEQIAILKALETHPLRTKDLAHSIGLPLARAQTLVQTLWQKGYIDDLSVPLLYYVFPGLRKPEYRQQPVAVDQFLALTTTGYFHLHPILQTAWRG